jgi:hypothetical protein
MAFSPALFLLGVPAVNFAAIASTGTGAVITSDGGAATAAVAVTAPDTAVTTVTATGTGTETFSISGGAEQNMFTIVAATGVLTFRAASVAGVYVVIVKALNDWGSDTQTITVTVS